jgi:hypothetical protein
MTTKIRKCVICNKEIVGKRAKSALAITCSLDCAAIRHERTRLILRRIKQDL